MRFESALVQLAYLFMYIYIYVYAAHRLGGVALSALSSFFFRRGGVASTRFGLAVERGEHCVKEVDECLVGP